METDAAHRAIVTMLAVGQPIWYVAAVTSMHTHDIHEVATEYGYPDRHKLRRAIARLDDRSERDVVA